MLSSGMRVHVRLMAAAAAFVVLFGTGTPTQLLDPVSAAAQGGASRQQPPPAPPAQTPQTPQQPPPQTPAQPPAGQQRPPVIRSGINFVSVDVIVTDKKSGEVVLDLKPDDFEVREDKKPQKVDTFDIVKIDALTSAA